MVLLFHTILLTVKIFWIGIKGWIFDLFCFILVILFVRKNIYGSFGSPFRPDKWGDAFTEGCSQHWTWCVFHGPRGLINLMGRIFFCKQTVYLSYIGKERQKATTANCRCHESTTHFAFKRTVYICFQAKYVWCLSLESQWNWNETGRLRAMPGTGFALYYHPIV